MNPKLAILMSSFPSQWQEYGWSPAAVVCASPYSRWSEQRRACGVLREMCVRFRGISRPPLLFSDGVKNSLRLAGSIDELRTVCAILERLAAELSTEAWSAMTDESRLTAVRQALAVWKAAGHYTIRFEFTPGEWHTYTTEEFVQYGGTGSDAYSSEIRVTTHETRDPDKVQVWIEPPVDTGAA